MKFVIPTILLAISTRATAQAVTAIIAPADPAPPSCTPSHPAPFKIAVAPLSDSSTTLAKRAADTCSNPSLLVLTLHDSILTDAKNRTGYIASNRQFQFDDPPQSGALLTAGFSVCSNGSLAMGGSTVWYQCKSGDFSNLYDQNWAPQCEGIHLQVIECDSEATVNAAAEAQAVSIGLPICEIGDGQIQAHTTPCFAPAVTVAPTTSTSGSFISVSSTFTPSTATSEPSGVTSAPSMESSSMATSVKSGSVTTTTVPQSSETMMVSGGERVQVGFWAGVLGVVAMI